MFAIQTPDKCNSLHLASSDGVNQRRSALPISLTVGLSALPRVQRTVTLPPSRTPVPSDSAVRSVCVFSIFGRLVTYALDVSSFNRAISSSVGKAPPLGARVLLQRSGFPIVALSKLRHGDRILIRGGRLCTKMIAGICFVAISQSRSSHN